MLVNENLSVGHGLLPCDLLVKEAPEASNPVQAIAIALGYPPELDRRYTEDNICFTQRNGELNLVMAWKFPSNCDVYTTGDIHLASCLD